MMILCIIVWALAFPLIKLALYDLSFVTLTIIRFMIVCLASIGLIMSFPKKFSPLYKKDVIPIFLLGVFGVMVYHFGLNYGQQYVSAGASSLIIATIPIFSVVLAVVFLKERLTTTKIFGIILALVGVMIISLWGTAEISLEITYLSGALAILVAAVMGSLYTIAGKKLLVRYNPLSLTLYAMLLGSLILFPIALRTPTFLSELKIMSATSWFAVLFLGLCSTVIGYVLWYVALQKKQASEVSTYLYGIPLLSTIISYNIFRDQITVLFFIGGVFVISGLILVNKNEKKSDAQKF